MKERIAMVLTFDVGTTLDPGDFTRGETRISSRRYDLAHIWLDKGRDGETVCRDKLISNEVLFEHPELLRREIAEIAFELARYAPPRECASHSLVPARRADIWRRRDEEERRMSEWERKWGLLEGEVRHE
jgi:hypothetical protein